MRLSTLWSLVSSGRARLFSRLQGLTVPFYRASFISGAAGAGLLRLLASGPADLGRIAEELGADHDPGRGALGSWLEMGVAIGVLGRDGARYALGDRFASALARPENDDVLAFLEETASLHHRLLVEAPERAREGRFFTLADSSGTLVARSSRVLEPFVREAVADAVPARGPVRLFEIGCGSGIYIRHAAERNPELVALGLELQPEVAAAARQNLDRWGLAGRATVEEGDVRARPAEPAFDLATLHNNIYYFPREERVAVLSHVRGFLRPGGRLLLTTACAGGGPSTAILDLWGALTDGCGRLPSPEEMASELREAGFAGVAARNILAPMDRFYSFLART